MSACLIWPPASLSDPFSNFISNAPSSAPSARTTTAWCFAYIHLKIWAQNPYSPSISNLYSGIKQKLTSQEAVDAFIAINPESLPINFTIPTPFGALSASVFAAQMIYQATSHDVSYPNDQSMIGISLSIVLGIPHTEMFRFY